VKPTRIRSLCPDAVFTRVRPLLRNRGLTNSSMPKFTSARAVPSSAMATPAGTNHHQAPCARACWPWAQNRMVPQFHVEIDEMPMKASVISDRTAKMTVPTKPDAMIAVRLGRISKRMMRQVFSPVARAAST
jgi:hypothetical protein